MQKKSFLFWMAIVLLEICCIIALIRYFYRQYTFKPKELHVLPIEKESLQFPKDTALQFFSEPKPNIQKQEDLSLIGVPTVITHTLNEDGLNERFNYSIEKNPDVFRIVSLGDSFTEGAFVDTKDNYSEILEDMLNTKISCPSIARFEVINLGVEGYDMQYILERFKRNGEKYRPDLVILWTHENDYTESNEKLGALTQEYDPYDKAPEKVQMYKEQGDYYPALTVLVEEYFRRHTRQELVDEELGYFHTLVTRYNGPLLVFSLETFPEDIKEIIYKTIQDNPSAHFYPNIPASYSAFPDQHPSVQGHKEFAEFLFSIITHEYISTCK